MAIGRLKLAAPAAQALGQFHAQSEPLCESSKFNQNVNKGHTLGIEPSSTWVAGDTTRRALWILMGGGGLSAADCIGEPGQPPAGASHGPCARSGPAIPPSAPPAVASSDSSWWKPCCSGEWNPLLGLLASFAIVRALSGVDVGIARLAFVTVDVRVLLFTMLVGLATSVATGLASAFQASQGALVPALKEGERGAVGLYVSGVSGRSWSAAEVALAMTLLIGAGLLLRSFDAVMRVDCGFQTEHRMLVQLNPHPPATTTSGCGSSCRIS